MPAKSMNTAPDKANGKSATGLVVLVEENDKLRKAYADKLSDLGFMVAAAGDGHTAMNMLFANVPKLLILNVVLQDIDGIELCRRAREILGDHVPFIFLSALDDLEVVQLCLEAGGNDFLIKDGDLDRFEERVLYWSKAGAIRRHKRNRDRTLATVRAAVQEREVELDGTGGLSSENNSDVAEISNFIRHARDVAGKSFGKTIVEKLYLIGYVVGAVNYWTTLKSHMKSDFGDYLRPVLRETEILNHHEITLLLSAWDELAKEPLVADAINKGTYEAVVRTQKGRHFRPVGLIKFAQSSAGNKSFDGIREKLLAAAQDAKN